MDYMAYTANIGELATKYTWPSVIQYDDDYRVHQFDFKYPCGSDSPHLTAVNLEVHTKGQV